MDSVCPRAIHAPLFILYQTVFSADEVNRLIWEVAHDVKAVAIIE